MRDRRDDDAHRDALERKLGRPLGPDEVADHRDGDQENNAPANLEVKTRSEHSRRHADPAVKTQMKLKKALTMVRRKEKLY